MENDNENVTEVVKTGDWLLTCLITAIPLVGFVMLFVWAFGSGTNLNKANWAKAMLLWSVIIVAIYVFILLIFGATLFSAFR